MKKLLLSIVFLMGQLAFGQISENAKEKELVAKTIQNYIDGSSYTQLEKLESAFYPQATLYLTMRDGFRKMSVKDYTSLFNPVKANQFNGRRGKLLEIAVVEDIARAKVSIEFSKSNMEYIDLFLLKKIAGEWKIISKTATRLPEPEKKKILFVVSNAHFYKGSTLPTGNSFSEIVNAYDVFVRAGYEVDFVSPKGGAIPLAYINTSDTIIKQYLYNATMMQKLKNSKRPEDLDVSAYAAVQYIGGGSAMFEVPQDEQLGAKIMQIYEEHNGVISSVCHGTAGIVHLKKSSGAYLVAGKRVNGYPDAFENPKKAYYKTLPFLIGKTIEQHGGTFVYGDRNKPYVLVDGRLVTGQNYLSSKPVSEKVIELIEAAKNSN